MTQSMHLRISQQLSSNIQKLCKKEIISIKEEKNEGLADSQLEALIQTERTQDSFLIKDGQALLPFSPISCNSPVKGPDNFKELSILESESNEVFFYPVQLFLAKPFTSEKFDQYDMGKFAIIIANKNLGQAVEYYKEKVESREITIRLLELFEEKLKFYFTFQDIQARIMEILSINYFSEFEAEIYDVLNEICIQDEEKSIKFACELINQDQLACRYAFMQFLSNQ